MAFSGSIYPFRFHFPVCGFKANRPSVFVSAFKPLHLGMFRGCVLLVLGLICFLPAKAQEGFRIGTVTGLATTQVSGDGLGGFHKVGPVAGAFVQRSFVNRWKGQLEMIYIQKGSRSIPRAMHNNVSYTLQLNYIEIPLLVQYQLRKFLYEVGPSAGVLIGYREFTHLGDLNSDETFNKTEFGFNLGIGFDLKKKFRLTWRFSHSVWRVRQHAGGATFRLNFGQYNSVLSFLLHYRL